MSNDSLKAARKIGCSPLSVDHILPLTYSQIILLSGYIITNPRYQTGPHYDPQRGLDTSFYSEAGPDGIVISFTNPLGGTSAEIGFVTPTFRSASRHVYHAHLRLSPGDFVTPTSKMKATLSINDAGFRLTSNTESELTKKYGQRQYNRWGYNPGGKNSLGYNATTTSGITLDYQWEKGSHIHGWSLGRNTDTTVVSCFGLNTPPRILPAMEATFSYDTFKTMLNKSGRSVGSEGALYWAIDPVNDRVYVEGCRGDGEPSLEGAFVRAQLWKHNGASAFFASTIPYRPFGEGVVNRYKTAKRAGFGVDTYGRPYIVLYWDWGYVRFNYIALKHPILTEDLVPETGTKSTIKRQTPIFVESWALNFEYNPYDDAQEELLAKWYRVWQEQTSVTITRPTLPKKTEILSWWIAFCQDGEVTEQDELASHRLLG